MRITRELLHKTARDIVASKLRSEKDLIAAYLVGSSLGDDFLLGGMTDIDVILVHSGDLPHPREFIRVNDDIHVDIVHYSQKAYGQPRELRGNPWLGYSMQANPLLLYDVRHWFEFTQASVGSQFYRADNVLSRAKSLAEVARTSWEKLVELKRPHSERVRLYFKALYAAGNALISLDHPPITMRRFGLYSNNLISTACGPDLFAGFAALSQINLLEKDDLLDLLKYWERSFTLACQQEKRTEDLHHLRKDYYLKAFQEMIEDEDIETVVFPLLYTWTKSTCCLLSTTAEYDAWLRTMTAIHLGKEEFEERIQGLDAFLDRVEEYQDVWAAKNGA